MGQTRLTQAAEADPMAPESRLLRVAAPSARVALVRAGDYAKETVATKVRQVLQLLGDWEDVVRPGHRVLLKPNLLTAKNPARAITTHPEVVRALIHEVRRAGGTPILGDSPAGVIRGTARLWRETGMEDLAREEGVELVSLEAQGADPHRLNGRLIPLTRVLSHVDAIINLPKLKTHSLTLYTGALKNCFGLVPGFQKGEFHKSFPRPADFSRLLVDIWRLVRPSVSVMDGIMGMEGDGPSAGRPRAFGLLAASRDGVALDAVASSLMGFAPAEIDTTRLAGEGGWGQADPRRIEVVGEDPAKLRARDVIFPRPRIYHRIPPAVVRTLGRLVWVRPYLTAKKCVSCSLCRESCPSGALELVEDRPRFDYRRCISCMCCQEICPEAAIYPRLSRLARLWDGSR